MDLGESEPRDAVYEPESEYMLYGCGRLRIESGGDMGCESSRARFSFGSLRLREMSDKVLSYMESRGRRWL